MPDIPPERRAATTRWQVACSYAKEYVRKRFNKEWYDNSVADAYMAARNGYLAAQEALEAVMAPTPTGYPGDEEAIRQSGISPRFCSCVARACDDPHGPRCEFWHDVLAIRSAWKEHDALPLPGDAACNTPDTLVRWMTNHTWRCACKPPTALNSAGAYMCRDCGTVRPQAKGPV